MSPKKSRPTNANRVLIDGVSPMAQRRGGEHQPPEPDLKSDGTQSLPATESPDADNLVRLDNEKIIRRAPLGTRVGSGLLGWLLYYGLFLVVGSVANRFGAEAPSLWIFALLYLLLVSIPLTVVFGQSPGQFALGLEVARSRNWRSAPRRPGLIRAIVHIALLVVLFPIDWIPLVFRSSRTLHEIVAGTVVVDVSHSNSKIRQRWANGFLIVGWLSPFIGLTVSVIVAGSFTDVVAVLAIPALFVAPVVLFLLVAATFVAVYSWRNRPVPAELLDLAPQVRFAHLLHFTPGDLDRNRGGRLSLMQRLRLLSGDLAWWSLAVLWLGGPAMLFIAMQAGKVPLDFLKSAKLGFLALFVVGAGVWASYRAIDSGIDAVRGRVRSQLTGLHHHSRKGNLLTFLTFYRLLTDDGQELKVWRAAFDTVTTRHVYRVYFTPLSKQLISLEDEGVAHNKKQTVDPPSR